MNSIEARKILGVDKNADEKEIKKAYRLLAKKHHPDKEGGDAQKFIQAKEAFDTLTNPQKASVQNPNNGWADVNVEEIFKRYKEQFDAAQSSIVQTVALNISLKDVFNGCEQEINLQNGTNIETIKIKIPKGSQNKDVIYSGKVGQVNIRVVLIIPDDEMHVDWVGGNNIVMNGIISCVKLMTGGTQEFKTIDGSNVMVHIPSGMIAGRLLKVKGRGYWFNTGCKNRGDLYIRVIPEMKSVNQLTEEEAKSLLDAINKEFPKLNEIKDEG